MRLPRPSRSTDSGRECTDRAQMGPIGLTLVFGFVLVGSILVIAFGLSALSGAEETLSEDRAEKALTQFDSKAALVALGNTDTQTVTFPSGSGEDFGVHEERGWMNVSYVNASGATIPIFNETMGAITYDSGESTVAYQGGGVWRSSGTGESVMVSPPEFHYRDRTLTLPMVSVSGEGSLGDDPVVTHNHTEQYFPDASKSGFANPVNGTEVNVTVKSGYYRAWGSYFEERTEGNVTYNHDRQLAMISLMPPFDEEYENVVASTDPNGITANGGNPPSPNEEGVNYPTVDSRIEEKIDDCQSSGCPSIPATITSSGTYFSNSGYSGTFVVDDPGGNVTIVVNGDYDPGNVQLTNIDDPHAVDVYVRGDVDFSSDYNIVDGDPYESRVVVHSSGDVNRNGNSKFIGLVYAPQSDCSLNGGGPPFKTNLEGGMVCKTLTINGNPNKFEYDEDIRDIKLGLNNNDVTQLQYLHVTTNEINVTTG